VLAQGLYQGIFPLSTNIGQGEFLNFLRGNHIISGGLKINGEYPTAGRYHISSDMPMNR